MNEVLPITAPADAPRETHRARPRILCVDDEPMVVQSLAATLRKHFEVFTAPDGPTGLEVLEREGGLPVVIADYRMPRMDGVAFLARVREVCPSARRILLSGAGAEGDVTGDPGLVFRLLAKPCPREELIRAIQDALADRPEGAPCRP